MLEVGAGFYESAATLGHLVAVYREEAVGVDRGGRAQARGVQHGRPEQAVEIDDVLADKVVQLGVAALLPVGVEGVAGALTVVLEAGDIAYGGIQPHVEILAWLSRDFEAEVGRIAADVPLLQAGIGPFAEFVRDLGLQGIGIEPGPEHVLEGGQGKEEVGGLLLDGGGAGDCRDRVDQFVRAVGGPAGFAVVAVLVRCLAAGAGTLDEAVGQEQLLLGVESLGDGPGSDMPVRLQVAVDLLAPVTVFSGVGGIEIVEVDEEAGAVALVLAVDIPDLLLGRDPQFFSSQHDRGAVGVIGTDIQAIVTPRLLESHPDIGLYLLQQVPQV